MRSIALANQKGGVGKTTTAIHLAHGLSLRGERVMLVDLDPQGNAMVALQGMGEDTASPDDSLRPVCPGFWIMDGCPRGGKAPDASHVQRLAAQIGRMELDWVIADCPPRMDEWGRAGLFLCDEVLIPVQAEFLAMHGLSQILGTLDGLQGHCRLLGVLPTMVDMREQVSIEVVASLRSNLGELVFDSVVLRDSGLVEAASHGESVFTYSPASKAAFCYGEVIREVCDGRPETR